jgi:hypothetical protein
MHPVPGHSRRTGSAAALFRNWNAGESSALTVELLRRLMQGFTTCVTHLTLQQETQFNTDYPRGPDVTVP